MCRDVTPRQLSPNNDKVKNMPERVNFGKLEEVLDIPDLIGVQLDSYRSFLQLDVPPEKRKNQGLQEIFNEVFPIESFDKQIRLEFVSYTVGTFEIFSEYQRYRLLLSFL